MRRIVIIGSGFAGIHAAQALEKDVLGRRGLRLTVISDRSHFLFTPLWAGVAAGATKLAQIAIPLRSLLADAVQVELDSVRRVDLARRVVCGDRGEIDYDFLVVAPGGATNWGANPHFEQVALPCRSGRDAVDAHDAVVRAFEAAAASSDATERRRLLTFVVVGAGPAGVELAGQLAARLDTDPKLRPDLVVQARIVVVEQQPDILPSWPVELRRHALDYLESNGVELRTSESVIGCAPERVELSSHDALGCGAIFWCGGVRPPPWLAESGFEVDEAGRVVVHRTLQAVGQHGVYVAGDVASADGAPMTADVAVSQAGTVCQNILADLTGRSRRDWTYESGGTFLSLAPHHAVASYRGVVLTGRPAQALWGAMSTRLLPAGMRGLTLLPSLFAGAFTGRSSSGPNLLSE